MEENNKKNPTNTNVIGEIVNEMIETTKTKLVKETNIEEVVKESTIEEVIEEKIEEEVVVPDLINNKDVEVHGRYNLSLIHISEPTRPY